ncbi:SEL1-like repeat protein [Patescibacteria group bacterium]|nr:SEL1-like repeat protein [Patescibacteria group bacterium]
MKKLILIICLIFPLGLYAQQGEYSDFLKQAKEAAKNNDAKGFDTNLRYFSAAIERDNITPSTLSSENRELYMEALFQALAYSEFEISEETATKALDFIHYRIEDSPRQMFALGRLYAHGAGVKQDYTQAKYWYEKAAKGGDDFAMNNLGNMYHDGEGVSKDYAKAKYWYDKAVLKDNEVAMSNMGVLYENGQGVTQDYSQAKYWYEKSAEKGSGVGMNKLGNLYKNGKGFSQDYSKAKNWYEKGAEKGDADAMNNLGVLYENGQGVTQDYSHAKHWYEKSAEKGQEYAMNNLGNLYLVGHGVPEDNTKAKYWFEKAAEKGNASGMANMGVLYDYGYGVEADWIQALHWYKKAAEKDNAFSLRMVGEFYLFGVGGVSKNRNKAIEFFEQAAKLKDEKAESYLRVLQDIENRNYYTLSNSASGNMIYIERDNDRNWNEYPWTITKYGAGWGVDIHYFKNNDVESVQIFPTYAGSKEKPKDEIRYTGYSSSSYYKEAEGSHTSSVGWKKETGNRAIGYVYYTGYFSNGMEFTIKAPVAVCWLPEKDY